MPSAQKTFLKKNILIVGLFALVFVMYPQATFAQDEGASGGGNIFSDVTEQLESATEEGGFETTEDPEGQLTGLIGNIVNISVGALAVVAVLLLIYAGGLWLTAAGNDDQVTTAKKIIKGTIVGIIIVGLAYGITSFILSQLDTRGVAAPTQEEEGTGNSSSDTPDPSGGNLLPGQSAPVPG